MFALLKKRRIKVALVAGFALVFSISYFALARTHKLATFRNRLPATRATVARAVSTDFSRSLSLDSDNDGIPDTAELKSFVDRESFRRWFSLVAEMQFYDLSEQWNAEQRDCAGLVRFAWREALRRHNRAWFQKMGPHYSSVAPDVAAYCLEQGPMGEKLFRTDFGAYKESDRTEGRFSEFADARSLKSFNAKFVSWDRHYAQSGDLLFFYQPWVQKFPYHVMIFVGEPRVGVDGSNDWVVYHTGSSPTDEGTVKKVKLSVLDHHPNKRWRPIESNPNFLGFYRLKILD